MKGSTDSSPLWLLGSLINSPMPIEETSIGIVLFKVAWILTNVSIEGKHPTVPWAAKFWTCLRRLGLAPTDPPWLRPIASLSWDWAPIS